MDPPQLPPEVLAALKAEDQSTTLIVVTVVFTVIAFICVVLRFVTRLYFLRSAGWEDYFCALSMAFSICMGVCQIQQARLGVGKHIMFIPLTNVIMILKYLYFSILAYCLSLTLTKISVLLQYRRIFTNKQQRIAIYVVMGICVAAGIESEFTGMFSCIPVDAFWNILKKPSAKCVNTNALYYANGAINIVTDLLVAALPVKAIWGLQLPRKQKIALLAVLTLGWFVCVVSMIRLRAIVTLVNNPQDITWSSTSAAYWSAVEVNLGIVCASTPALKPLIVRTIPIISSKFGSNKSVSKGTRDLTRGTNDRRSFIELKGKSSNATMSDKDVERGERNVTALPQAYIAAHSIHVTKDFEQHFEDLGRNSDSGSHKDLIVNKFPKVFAKGPGRA